MRGFFYALILATGFTNACLADDPLADLRREVAAARASATLACAVRRRGNGGLRYVTRTVTLAGDSATYKLSYKSFLPPKAKLNRAKLNDWASGLGMVLPSTKGWYINGFVNVSLHDGKAGASIADYCGDAALVCKSGKVVAADYVWALPTGRVTLRFFLLVHRPELFLLVRAKPNAQQARLRVELLCYPGGFRAPFDRRVHTTARELAHAGRDTAKVKIDPTKETWMLLADHYAGVTPRPMGPCSVAADPAGIVAAGARIKGNYSVLPFYVLAPGTTQALFVIREFAPIPWRSALDDIAQTTAEALRAGRRALESLPQ